LVILSSKEQYNAEQITQRGFISGFGQSANVHTANVLIDHLTIPGITDQGGYFPLHLLSPTDNFEIEIHLGSNQYGYKNDQASALTAVMSSISLRYDVVVVDDEHDLDKDITSYFRVPSAVNYGSIGAAVLSQTFSITDKVSYQNMAYARLILSPARTDNSEPILSNDDGFYQIKLYKNNQLVKQYDTQKELFLEAVSSFFHDYDSKNMNNALSMTSSTVGNFVDGNCFCPVVDFRCFHPEIQAGNGIPVVLNGSNPRANLYEFSLTRASGSVALTMVLFISRDRMMHITPGNITIY